MTGIDLIGRENSDRFQRGQLGVSSESEREEVILSPGFTMRSPSLQAIHRRMSQSAWRNVWNESTGTSKCSLLNPQQSSFFRFTVGTAAFCLVRRSSREIVMVSLSVCWPHLRRRQRNRWWIWWNASAVMTSHHLKNMKCCWKKMKKSFWFK